MCCSRSFKAWVTAVAATPTCFRSWSSLVAALEASTQPSADLATNLPASISCSWQTGELIVGATTWKGRERLGSKHGMLCGAAIPNFCSSKEDPHCLGTVTGTPTKGSPDFLCQIPNVLPYDMWSWHT